MALSTITARVDALDKKSFDAFCASVGLNASTAINLFVKAVLRERRIPFAISQSQDPFFHPANQAYLLKSIRELREGKGHPHELMETGEPMSPDDALRILAKARDELSGVPEMTLDEINAEIYAARLERRAREG